jgi:hypothetical protein
MRWARQQNWLTCCRDDENQATGHAYILAEVNQLNRIKRCVDCPPEWMSDEGRRYQEQEQGKRRNTGVDSQDQAQTGDQLQSTPCHNQHGNKVARNAVSGQFVSRELWPMMLTAVIMKIVAMSTRAATMPYRWKQFSGD